MSRGSTLTVVRTLLKAELRDTQETNTVLDTEYNYLIANKQSDLALAYDWNFLEHRWDLTCTAGTRYFTIPTTDILGLTATINFEREVLAYILYSSVYEKLDYGISEREYNTLEGVNETQDPVQRWQVVSNVNETSNPNQIEVWPVPATTQTLRFVGQRQVKTLSSDSDTADLDDRLLAFFVAADYLALRELPNAGLMLKKAQDHLMRLRGGYPANTDRIVLGQPNYPNYSKENVKLIAVT